MNGEEYFSLFSDDEIEKIKADDDNKFYEMYYALISHEIRTPVNALLSLIYLMNKTGLDNIQQNYLAEMKHSVDIVTVLLNNILDFSKIESGKVVKENLDFDLHTLVSEVISVVGGQISEKGLDFIFKNDYEESNLLHGDPLKLKQVLFNLISNSLKFTKHGYIKLEINIQKRKDDNIVLLFSIEDTGIGINDDELSTLFNPFVQANSSISRKYGGTGLGLFICKKLVSILGGDIWCDSLSGYGTVFRFNAEFKVIKDKNIDLTNYNDEFSVPAHLQGIKVLLVEDDEINRILTNKILVMEGFDVSLCSNGREAVEATRKGEYDIILMDLQMPEMDGVEATREIRRNIKYENVPIVAMTANTFKESKLECEEAGMDDYLTKPIDPFMLYKYIERLVVL